VRNTEAGADVVWRDRRLGREHVEACDFVVSAMPPLLLGRTQNNLSQPFTQALSTVRMDAATKLAWQSERFWERDDHIFGGLTYVEHEVRFLWYPSNRLNTREGVLVGCYNTGPLAITSAAQTIEQRAAASRAAVELAHPGRGGMLRYAVSVVWADMPFNEGPWANLRPGPNYDLLNEPDGRVHLAGDWLSQLVGWQEGAALSGQRAVRAIIERTRTI
jgi:monoamine oxidase